MSNDVPQFRYDAGFANRMEPAWQARWAESKAYETPNPGASGFDLSKPRFYCLDMFPYPSGAGLHIGHPEGYTATDIICRYKRMTGHNVLHPMGWDAFGLPAEQYAIQTGVHPAITTRKAIDNFRRQLQRFGFSYDWSREFGTIDDGYYKWTQWIFLKLYGAWFDGEASKARPISELVDAFARGVRAVRFNPRADEVSEAERARVFGAWSSVDAATQRRIVDSYRLAYRSETTVNWCPKLGTVLANDEVIDGKSERGGFPVLRKPMKQWMFRITAYADRLIDQLEELDWPSSTKAMQREWIGRSEGAEIEFRLVVETKSSAVDVQKPLKVFTTRPDTLFGATYMVVAPEHELCSAIINTPGSADDATRAKLAEYVKWARNRSDVERQESKEKTGAFTGVYAINPATGKQIPVWTADYVMMGYGTGAIMAVPAHDERDWEFAEKFGLQIVQVVAANDQAGKSSDKCFSGDGVAINSASSDVSLNGLPTAEAKQKINLWLESKQIGKRRVNYKLRDWTFSRQRYWGEPFPIVYDAAGNAYPVGEKTLPVKLPELADYAPVESDDPQPLLAKAKEWMHTTAGEAGVDPSLLAPNTPVTRETNTMPGSAGSSWYAIRYCDPRNANEMVGREAEQYWMGGSAQGVDLYLGGSEHAVGHLLYSRFWQNALHDLGVVSCKEPFRKLFHQGLITSFAYQRSDKSIVPVDEVKEVSEGEYVEIATGAKVTPIITKMSKRYKNVINPDDVIAEFGADTCRLYEMYMGPLDASKPWNPRDISGCYRFLQRAWRLCVNEQTGELKATSEVSTALEKQLHRLIAKVGGDIERLAFNTAIAAMMEFVNAATGADKGQGSLTRDQVARFAQVLAPFVPHFAEELWSRVASGSVVTQTWPAVDAKMLVDDEIEVPVSVNGKVKTRIMVPAAVAKEAKGLESFAMAHAEVVATIAGKPVKKVIAVPGKMVNVVV
ncbi:MAG TPA: leucine--tRNA ligase [Phycisphaerales bacterium]|nr:leucine--tRNA ligase [Phycisphaerales bacterium]